MTVSLAPRIVTRRSHDELREIAEQGNVELGSLTDHEASPAEVVAWVARHFGTDAAAVACSMADAALPHLVAEQLPGVDVLFLDTGYHFAETRHTRDEVGRVLDVRIVDVLPDQTVAEQDAEFGARLLLPRSGSVLRAPQGGAASGCPRRVRGVVHRRPPRGGAHSREHSADRVGRAQRPRQGEPGRGVDLRRPPRLRRRAPGSGQPPRDERIPLDRLRAVHQARRRRRRPRSGRWAGLAKTECGLHL